MDEKTWKKSWEIKLALQFILISYTDMDVITTATKGQIMSECTYEIINFPKYDQKNLIDFCPSWKVL
jgi:hypothetical protein